MKKKKLIVAALSIPIVLGGQQAYADAQTTSNATQEASKLEVQVKFDKSTGSFVTTNKNSTKPQAAITTPKAETKDAAEQQAAPKAETTNKSTDEQTSTQPVQSSKQEEQVELKVKPINVKVGEKADPRSAFENLPADATVEFVGTVDTSTAVTQQAEVKVTLDGQVKTYRVTINVEEKTEQQEAKPQEQDRSSNIELSDEIVNPSVGADPSTSKDESRQIDVEVNVDLLGLNNDAQQFNKNLLPDTIIAEITYTGADGKPYTTTVEIDKNNLNATVKAPLPVDAKNGELSVKFTNLKDMTSSEGYGSTKLVDGKITGFTITGHLGQYANPKVNLEVKNPYGRDEERKDTGDVTGNLNITGGDDKEDLDKNNKSLEFSFPKGTTEVDTHVNEDPDEQDNNLYDLTWPGNNPHITIDGEDETSKEVTVGETIYKVTEKTYDVKTGGKIVLTTTDPILKPLDGDDTPDGYHRVIIKSGEGVKHFDEIHLDVKDNHVITKTYFPGLTLLDGYRDAKWSQDITQKITGRTEFIASATKNDNLAYEPTSKVVIKKIKIAPTEEEIKKAVSVPGYPEGKTFSVTVDQDEKSKLIAHDEQTSYTVGVTVKYEDGTEDKTKVTVEVIGGHNFDYEPTTKVIETTVNKLPDAKDGITNKSTDSVEGEVKKLPADATFKWFEEPDVSEGTKEGKEVKGKVQVTYPDDSHDIVEVTVKVKDTRKDNEKYKATGGTINKKFGEQTTEEDIKNAVTIPGFPAEGTQPVVTVNESQTLPDGTKNETVKIKATVKYPDDSTQEVEVTVIVGEDTRTDAEKNNPEAAKSPESNALVTELNKLPKAEDGIGNKDQLTNVKQYVWSQVPDVSKVGDTTGKVLIQYNDGSTDEVEVPVTVVDSRKDNKKYTAQGGTINKKFGEATTEEDIKNAVTIPGFPAEGTQPVVTVNESQTLPDGTKNETVKIKATVKYPDDSTQEVEVTVIVGEDTRTDAEKNNPEAAKSPESNALVTELNKLPKAEDGIGNKDQLTNVKQYVWSQVPDVSKVG
ncbi:hypothetical protein B9N58_06845, partial [Finegoldia magna]|uniref:Rib/alpha-like domain-containing protein n=1 Tax=Finegoldia magna TaxID=1260 RepID=UPI000B9F64D6